MAAWALAATVISSKIPIASRVISSISMSTETLDTVILAAEVLASVLMASRVPDTGALGTVGLPIVVKAVVGQSDLVVTDAVLF